MNIDTMEKFLTSEYDVLVDVDKDDIKYLTSGTAVKVLGRVGCRCFVATLYDTEKGVYADLDNLVFARESLIFDAPPTKKKNEVIVKLEKTIAGLQEQHLSAVEALNEIKEASEKAQKEHDALMEEINAFKELQDVPPVQMQLSELVDRVNTLSNLIDLVVHNLDIHKLNHP